MYSEHKETDYKGFEIFNAWIVKTHYFEVKMPFPYPNDNPLFPSLEKAKEFIDGLDKPE